MSTIDPAKISDYIDKYIKRHGIPPVAREIATAIGHESSWRSVSAYLHGFCDQKLGTMHRGHYIPNWVLDAVRKGG
jgi:hypothetical protein